MTDTDESTSSVGRRAFLAGSAATATALAGCIGGGGGGGEALRVSTWSGTNAQVFKETIKPMYEERTGNTLEVAPNWTQILSKIRAAPADDPPFDLTVGGSRIHYLGDQGDLWAPVDYDNVARSDAIKPQLLENRSSDRGVPLAYGVMGQAYLADGPSWEPERWADLTTEAESVVLPGAFFMNPLMMGAIVTNRETMESEVYDPEGLESVLDTMREMPIDKFYSDASDLWSTLSGGTANVGQYYFAYAVAKDSTSDLDVEVNVPERTTGYTDYYQIVRGTDNRETAEEFLGFMLDPEVQTAYANEFNLGMAHPDAELPERSRNELPITESELDKVAFKKYSLVAERIENIRQQYEQFKTSVV